MGDLTNLIWLYLSSNGLSGSIPAELGDLTNLESLNLSSNGLSGSIPAELGDLTNLERLYLSWNGLSGSVPAELGDLTNLERLYLFSNGLSGSIPAELGDLTNLRVLSLWSNSLSGGIPAELGDLTNLEVLYLQNNGLSGSIPAELGDLTNLRVLSLESNDFSGCVPAALTAVFDIRFDADLSYCGDLELVSAVLVGGSAVELTFDKTLDESSVPSVGAFSVGVDGASRTISGVAVAGRVVRLTLASPITSAQRVTVSYTAPTADSGRIETTGGDAAEGFTDQPVTIPPDPPTITAVESTTGGLTVTWTPVADISGYDVEWRPDAEQTWQSNRTGLVEQHTIGDLTNGALHWVRVRAVKTDGELTGQTLYTTAWSQAQRTVAGDWTPQNLQVTSGDRMLAVTWDTVAGADDYDVRYVPEAGGGGAVTRSARAARAVATDDFAAARSALAVLSDDGSAARAAVTGLDNGTTYDVQVRAQRTVTSPSGAVTLSSTPASTKGTPGVAFRVADVSFLGESFVRSRGNVYRTFQLDSQFPAPVGASSPPPFANQPIGAYVKEGPSSTTAEIKCLLNAAVAPASGRGPYGECITDDHGRVTIAYRAAEVRLNSEVGADEIYLYIDADRDGVQDPGGETSSEKHGDSVMVYRPINLVALGDSYTAGQNGDPQDERPGGFRGFYVQPDGAPIVETYEVFIDTGERVPDDFVGPIDSTQLRTVSDPLDAPCRRWSLAYSQMLPAFQSRTYSGDSHTFACSGAISLNIHYPAGLSGVSNLNPGVTYSPAHPLYVLTDRLKFAERPSRTDTNRPSHEFGLPVSGRNARQAAALVETAEALEREGESVDMVVLTIGGNDVGFSDVLTDCLIGRCLSIHQATDHGEGVNPTATYFIEVRLDELRARLQPILETLKQSFGDAAIFVMGYPQLVPDRYRFGDCPHLTLADIDADIVGAFGELIDAGLTDPEREFLRGVNVDLNRTISDVAGDAGAHFVPVVDEFAGHEACGSGSAWINGVVAGGSSFPYVSNRSVHPNEAGHRAYARVLRRHIDDEVAAENPLNYAGLPRITRTTAATGSQQRSDRAASARAVSGAAGGSTDALSQEAATETLDAVGFLLHRRVVSVASGCGAPFLSPGEQVELTGEGFAAGSSVSLSARGMAAGGEAVVPVDLPGATADDDGRISAVWTVPTLAGESAPRGYVFEATGTAVSGGSLAARSIWPLVAYPAVAPCAGDDAASTMVGRPVRVAVLGNDVAPAGGSLVAASVAVDPVDDGDFSLNATDGAVTFTPDPGFVGTAATTYRVYDNWGVGVVGTLTVTVEAGCTITGTAGVVDIAGTDGDDVICVPDPDDWDAFHRIDAKGGDDVIIGGDGVEWIHAGAGSDVVYGRGGEDRIDGGPGADTIDGGDGFDTIFGADLADVVHDDAEGHEVILVPPAPAVHDAPVPGDDAAYVRLAATVELGVLDNDHDPNGNLVATSLSITRSPTLGAAHVVLSPERDVTVRYVADEVAGVDTFAYEVCDTLDACTTANVTVTVGTAGCTIVGTDGDDTLSGTAGPDVICGLGGNDVIHGLGGGDVLVGGPGDDRLYGGDETNVGDDGSDSLFGGPGDDTLFGGPGADVLWGGAGGDALAGNRGDDTIHGGAGNDIAVGGAEDDVLWGGAGDDNLDGHAGDDTVYGGAGRDILSGGNGDDALFGGAGNDQLTGGAGADTLWGGADIDLLWGNTQDDTLHGGAGIDILRGGGGDDRLTGGAGDDQLHGNAGDDRLWGGTGSDSLDGGNGTDHADGGDGADTCARGESVARCEP